MAELVGTGVITSQINSIRYIPSGLYFGNRNGINKTPKVVMTLWVLDKFLVTPMINHLDRDLLLSVIVLVLVSGSLVLAVIDPSTRPMFCDLTKVAVGAYIGLHIPAPNQQKRETRK
ncbi:MAG TPA: hypothetical protein VK211_21040 [Kamptonema sp.]|nr:hypothetical protein [Kamptonema sp.]